MPRRLPTRESASDSEVVGFLRDAGLERYTEKILGSGFDDMETLRDIQDGDMLELGIPSLHAARLRARLTELQSESLGADGARDAEHPVVRFLEEVGLGQYAEALFSTGFDEMETLYEIEDADLRDLGVPRGHALKLQKRLREHNAARDQGRPCEPPHCAKAAAPEPAPPPRRALPPPLRPKLATSAPSLHAPAPPAKSAVQRSWDEVQTLGTYAVAEILYRNLFQAMPEAVQLFPSHVREKYREWHDEDGDESNILESPALRALISKVLDAVGCAVSGQLDNTQFVSMLVQLGQRHAHYGVHAAHFDALGKALTLTLREVLGSHFTKEVEDAWAMGYCFMTSIMKQGLRLGDEECCVGHERTESTASTLRTPMALRLRAADALCKGDEDGCAGSPTLESS